LGLVKAETNVKLNLWTEKPLFEVDRFVLQTREKSFYHLSDAKKSSPEQSIYQTLNNVLSHLSRTNRFFNFNTIDLQVADFQLQLPNKENWVLHGTITKQDSADSQAVHVHLTVASKDLAAEIKGDLDKARLGSDRSFLKMEVSVAATGWSFRGPLLVFFNNQIVKLQSQSKIEMGDQKKPLIITPQLQVTISENAIYVKSQMSVNGLPGPIANLQKVEASLRIPLENDSMWGEDPATLQLNVPVDFFWIDQSMRISLESACSCKLPEILYVNLIGKAWLKKYFSENKNRQKIIEASLSLQRVKNKLFSADLAGNIDVFRENGGWLFDPRLDADVTIHSFQGLRHYLDAQGVIVPAPLDILEGTIGITTKSPVGLKENGWQSIVEMAVDLKSPTQVVLAEAKVSLQLANSFKSLDVDLDALIRTLKLDLPPLDPVLGFPALTSDKRILRKFSKNVNSKFQVRVVSRLRTQKAGAIQLYSRFAKPNIPLSILLNCEGAESTGFVRFEPFTVNYLRRKIYVEKINISLTKNEEEDLPIDGRFWMEQGGYKIFIALSGTVQSPTISLTSDPVLTKNDIISVLIYGRLASELVANEAETAGNVNAAVADRAIGLFGLWAFASTPIQSFSYNATTKVYTATVDLGNGVTAGVGTNWEQATNFELRKRVSSRWVLTATWAPNQNNRQQGRLVLQWEKRF
jgi:TamB, inner membrane protein subunit of TAM complex